MLKAISQSIFIIQQAIHTTQTGDGNENAKTSRQSMKRKHHNAFKRCQNVFSNVRLWSWESERENGVQTADGKARIGFVWRYLNQQQVSNIVSHSNNWIIVCRALCRLGDDEWIESEMIAAHAMKVNDFQNEYRRMREGVLASVNRKHVIDVGWIVQSFKDIAKLDDESLPLFELGKVSDERRNSWLITDSEIVEELRKA